MPSMSISTSAAPLPLIVNALGYGLTHPSPLPYCDRNPSEDELHSATRMSVHGSPKSSHSMRTPIVISTSSLMNIDDSCRERAVCSCLMHGRDGRSLASDLTSLHAAMCLAASNDYPLCELLLCSSMLTDESTPIRDYANHLNRLLHKKLVYALLLCTCFFILSTSELETLRDKSLHETALKMELCWVKLDSRGRVHLNCRLLTKLQGIARVSEERWISMSELVCERQEGPDWVCDSSNAISSVRFDRRVYLRLHDV
ncbi:hypothetical protein Tco_0454142 [Tanacetum coccineum]